MASAGGGDQQPQYPPERLVPSDPAWPQRFADLAAAITAELGGGWEVEHVGSTSVPGLVAKPVVDLALRVPRGSRMTDGDEGLRRLGWSETFAVGGHHAAVLHDGRYRCAVAHLFTAEQWPTAHVRLFADWLREHQDDRDSYARLKRDLVAGGIWGHDYTRAKAAFVQDVVDRARAARGLPPVPLQP